MMNLDWYSELYYSNIDPESTQEFTIRYYKSIVENKKADADNIREKWKKCNISKDINNPFIKLIDNPSIDISLFPKYSFHIQFKFTLEKPYISNDEQDFYIIDNPIRKDKVFNLPYVAPSSWKGSLRSALWQLDYKDKDDNIRRIFGNERMTKEHERLRAGRLHLFPTFFTNKSLEIINPHDRERKVGKNPILIESVPMNTSGMFTLLYVLFDLVGDSEKEIKKQVAKDIQLLAKGLNAMFREYGFGVKTSSGFGIAKSELTEGKLILKMEGINQKEEKTIQEPDKSFEKYLNENGSVKEEFKSSGDDGLLSNKEYNKIKDRLSGGSFTEYKEFKNWYNRDGNLWQKHIQSQRIPTPRWAEWNFKSFDELLKKTAEIENVLRPEEVSQ